MAWSRKFRHSGTLCFLCVAVCSFLFTLPLCFWEKTPFKLRRAQHAAVQKREGSSKDIFLMKQNRVRLHYRIESALSFLRLLPKERKLKIVEEMEQIRCWMEEENRQLRYFETDKGVYNFNQQQFNARKVFVSLYQHEGPFLHLYRRLFEVE